MTYRHKNPKTMTWLAQLGTSATAILALGALWSWFGIATSGDLRKLSCEYAPAAVAAWQSREANLLASAPSNNPRNNVAWQQTLREAQENLNAAIKRKIECGK